MTDNDLEKLRTIIGEAIGEASLCWDPRPTGVFESTRAAKICEHAWMRVLELVSSPDPVVKL